MKAFMGRKEAVKKASTHIVEIKGSATVQNIKVRPMDSSVEDYNLELKAFMVTMSYTGGDQAFKAFDSS